MSARPVHLRWSHIAVVFLGGTAGTACREYLSLVLPPTGPMEAGSIQVGPLPAATLAVNLLGAFLLGVLLDALLRRGPDAGARRTLRLALGTGFLGGFTTYSALATETSLFLRAGDVPTALLYSFGTVLMGALATWLGIALAGASHRRPSSRRRPPVPDPDAPEVGNG